MTKVRCRRTRKCRGSIKKNKSYCGVIHLLIHLPHEATHQLSSTVPPRDTDQNLGASLCATLSLCMLIFWYNGVIYDQNTLQNQIIKKSFMSAYWLENISYKAVDECLCHLANHQKWQNFISLHTTGGLSGRKKVPEIWFPIPTASDLGLVAFLALFFISLSMLS